MNYNLSIDSGTEADRNVNVSAQDLVQFSHISVNYCVSCN